MPKNPAHLLLGLLAALVLAGTGCSNYSDYKSNMTYVNAEILAKEETLALEQLHTARADYERALAAGSASTDAGAEKAFLDAREKYLVIKKEQALRAGRALSAKDIADDPELAIPGQPGGAVKKPAETPADAPTPATDDDVDAQAPEPAGASPTPTQAEATYAVQPGDTLGAIAKRHNVDVAALAAHNALASQNKIVPGQVLKIPHP